MVTVISHIYNEEDLLPFWLMHHRRLFDHGIIIDYNSTDASREIVQEYCPNWDIVPSRNSEFDPHAIDMEVMDIERAVLGWKICLNVTEIMFHHDLRTYLQHTKSSALAIPSVVLLDTPEEASIPLDKNRDIFLQRTLGVMPNGIERTVRSARWIHRHPDGQYKVGRHGTCHSSDYDPELMLLWLGICPLSYMSRRRKHIKERLSQAAMVYGLGFQHLFCDMDYLLYLRSLFPFVPVDLLTVPQYKKQLEQICETYSL